jgi:hypothetical protein
MAIHRFPCYCEPRFIVESQHQGTVCIDTEEGDLYHIERPLLLAVPYVLGILSLDVDALTEVYAVGEGLAMAGFLKAHGANVVSAHAWLEEH